MKMDTHLRVTAVHKPRRNAYIQKHILSLCLTLTLTLCTVFAQDNPLNRKISLRVKNDRLDDALYKIGNAGRFSFSYNSDLLPTDSLVSFHVKKQPVRKVMGDLLGKRMVYRQVGNHLVIRPRKPIPLPEEPPKVYSIDGYIIDGVTGEKVHSATIYENYKRTTRMSDAEGHYTIEVPGEARQIALSFNKRGYRDTVVILRPGREPSLTVGLTPLPQPTLASREVNLVGDSDFEDLPLVDFFVPEEQQARSRNFLSALKSIPIQISFVPSIGTNRLISGAMYNHFSLNILAGYSNGVKGVEIGGLANMNREHVYGAQVGGICNVVGGNVKGVQVGGIFNHVNGSLHAVQVGGIHNTVRDTVYGIQVGGIGNVAAKRMRGFQIAGVYNVAANDLDGLQIAGVANTARGNVNMLQIAGVSNVAAGDVRFLQIAGISNHAKGRIRGFQVAGIANVGKQVDGFQIGLVNVADTVGGFTLGLLNLVRKGYFGIDLSTNDLNQGELSLKTGGSQKFYSILSVGGRLGDQPHWSVGAGFGTQWRIMPRIPLTFDATIHQVNADRSFREVNFVIPARLSLGLAISDHFELYGGASLNLGIQGQEFRGAGFPQALADDLIWESIHPYTRTYLWAGYQAGIRIIR